MKTKISVCACVFAMVAVCVSCGYDQPFEAVAQQPDNNNQPVDSDVGGGQPANDAGKSKTDAGQVADGGAETDASVVADAGSETDSGVATDAGVSECVGEGTLCGNYVDIEDRMCRPGTCHEGKCVKTQIPGCRLCGNGCDSGYHCESSVCIVDEVIDAGTDAGTNPDVGGDAGADAGTDAGVDAGADAGQPVQHSIVMKPGACDGWSDSGDALASFNTDKIEEVKVPDEIASMTCTAVPLACNGDPTKVCLVLPGHEAEANPQPGCNFRGPCAKYANEADGGTPDAGVDAGTDAGADVGVADGGVDAGTDAGAQFDTGIDNDAGVDAGIDAGTPDFDGGVSDVGVDGGTTTDGGVDAGDGFCQHTSDCGQLEYCQLPHGCPQCTVGGCTTRCDLVADGTPARFMGETTCGVGCEYVCEAGWAVCQCRQFNIDCDDGDTTSADFLKPDGTCDNPPATSIDAFTMVITKGSITHVYFWDPKDERSAVTGVYNSKPGQSSSTVEGTGIEGYCVFDDGTQTPLYLPPVGTEIGCTHDKSHK